MEIRSRGPALLPICGIVAGSLTLGGAGAPALAQTTALVWEALFPDKAVVTPTVVDGIEVDVTTRVPFTVDSAFFDVAHESRATHFGYWRAYVDFADSSQYVEFTFRFNRPVADLRFIILDLDVNAVRHESLTVVAWNAGTPFPPTVMILGSGLRNPSPGAFTSRQYCEDDEPIIDCSVEVRFDQRVDSITFRYEVGPLGPADPAYSVMGISDLRWRAEVDVSAALSAPALVSAGSLLTYTLTLRNGGPAAAPDVVAEATLPPDATFVSASGGGTVEGDVVTWPAISLLAAGDSAARTVQVTAPAAGVLTAVARATGAAYDTDPSNNDGTWGAASATTTVSEQADVVASVAGPDTVGLAAPFSYTITVSNDGPSPALSILITDTLPAGVTFLGASDGGGKSGGVVVWPAIASLAAGASVIRTVDVSASSAGRYTNVVAATAATADPEPANNDGSGADGRVATDVIELTDPLADLVTLAAGPASAPAGGVITYTATVRNDGPSAAADVILRDTLPAGVGVTAVSGGGTVAAGVVTWPAIALLPVGAARSFTVSVTAPPTGTLVNIVAAAGATPDPWPGSNDGSAAEARVTTTVIEQADLVTLAGGPASVLPAGTFTHTVTVRNDGPSVSQQVVVTHVHVGGTIQSVSDGGLVSGGVVTWPAIASIASGQSVEYTVTMTAPASGSVTSQVSATSSTADPVAGNHDGSAAESRAVTTVTEVADLRVTASGPAQVAPGAVMSYRVVVRNQGPSTAAGVVVSDTLPAGFNFTAASNGGTWTAGVVTWPAVASLAVGDSLQYSVDGRAPATGLLVSIAAARAATLDPDPANNDGSDPASRVVSTMPLGVALNVLEVVDSVTAGSPVVHPASAQVVVVGTGADTLAWTVTSSGAAWLTFVTSTGTGSGTASWTLDVPSMRAGTYRDTLLLTLADGKSDTVAIRVEVVAPAVDWTAAVDEILGTTRLDVIQRRYLDQEGNADGAFNLGDLLALLDRLGVRLDDATLSRVMAASAAGRQK
jgi:uncharacterized repeat protein (TIGR01451 family)